MLRKIFSSISSQVFLKKKNLQESAVAKKIITSIKKPVFFSVLPVDPYLIFHLKFQNADSKPQRFIKEFLDGQNVFSLNKENDFGHTLVRFAALKGRKDVLEYLDMFDMVKFDLGGRDRRGKTALMLAAEAGHFDVVQYLLQTSKGAFIEGDSDHQGNTAAMLAAKKGYKAIVELLLENAEARVYINERNIYDQNILMLAARRGHHSVVEYLLNDYAGSLNLEAKDEEGRSAFDMAATIQIQELISEARKARYYLSSRRPSKSSLQP